jgi:adenosylcobinamide-GDP ribazoletransferase
MRPLRQALAFLTPIGGAAAPGPGALRWFGVVGALIGAAVGGVWFAAGQVLPALVAASVAVTADAALTGLLHLDGLADAADGLLPPLPAERRLAVMRDPHVGAFGVTALVLVLALRIAALTYLASRPATILAVAALWCAARTAMAVAATSVTYARPGGLATAFMSGDGTGRSGPAWLAPVAAGAPLALVLGVLGTTPAILGVLAVAAAAIGAAIVVTFARGRIGGFTGDVLGAAGVVAETLGLLLLVVGP